MSVYVKTTFKSSHPIFCVPVCLDIFHRSRDDTLQNKSYLHSKASIRDSFMRFKGNNIQILGIGKGLSKNYTSAGSCKLPLL